MKIMVIAKAPVVGAAKTRLVPPCSHAEAARIAEAALLDTLQVVAATPCDARVVVAEGDVGALVPSGFDLVPQRGVGLAERLSSAFADVGGPGIVIAMDTPQVTTELLGRACDAVTATDAVIGMTEDGGYWIIGLRAPDPRVFDAIEMSTAATGAAQRARLAELELTITDLPVLRDVDTFADATAVAALIPDSRFASAVAAVAEPEVIG